MKKLLFPMMLATAVILPHSGQAEVKVEPAGMKIVWKSLKDEFDGFQTYNSSEGTYLSLAVSGGDKGFIAFDKDKSKISITDGSNDMGGKFGMWNKISKNAKVMRVEVTSEKLPASGTKSLEISGSLSVTVASDTTTKATEPRPFKKGDKVELSDDFKFVIDKIEKPKWGDDPLSVTLKWTRKIPELAAVRFYDGDGKLIESSSAGSSWGGFLGKYTVTKSYRLKKKSDVLKIEMDLWTDAESISVPVKLKLAISGGK